MKRIRAHFSARLLAAPIEGDLPIEDEEDKQEFSGKDTSLTPAQMKNSVPALFNKIPWQSRIRVFDIGAGKPLMADALKQWFELKDITYLPYDKFNGESYNFETVNQIRRGKADVATASNLLNVIAEPKSRLTVYKQMYNALKAGGKFYISVYYAPNKRPGQSGKDKWQNHIPAKAYLEEVQTVFPDARIQNGLITGTNI